MYVNAASGVKRRDEAGEGSGMIMKGLRVTLSNMIRYVL